MSDKRVKQVRIGLVTPEYVTERNFDGGLANYLHRLTLCLRDMGHDPVVIVSSDRDEVLVHEGAELHRVLVHGVLYRMLLKINAVLLRGYLDVYIAYCWHSWRLNRKVREVHRSGPFDIVQYASYLATGLFRSREIPSVVRVSAYQPLLMQAYGENPSGRRVRHTAKLEMKNFRRADAVFCPSSTIARIIEARTGRKVSVIRSPYVNDAAGVDTALYDTLLKGKRYLLFYGSLGALKGVDVIASALPRIFEHDREVVFAFIGKDMGFKGKSMVEHVVSQAGPHAGRVIYAGSVPHDRLYPVIRNAVAVVLPSRFDNLPNTCIESMAMGKIVVGTRGASYDELIEDGVNGFLCGIGDPDSLYSAIKKTLDLSRAKRVRMEKAARESMDMLRPENAVGALIDFYHDVMRNTSC